jgi:hypothetical protein
MALTIKQLGLGNVRSANYASLDQNTLYKPDTGKSGVVKSVVFVNRAAAAYTLKVYVLPAAGTKYHVGIYQNLPQNAAYAIEDEITLAAGERLLADTGTDDDKLDFVVSGIERDV